MNLNASAPPLDNIGDELLELGAPGRNENEGDAHSNGRIHLSDEDGFLSGHRFRDVATRHSCCSRSGCPLESLVWRFGSGRAARDGESKSDEHPAERGGERQGGCGTASHG